MYDKEVDPVANGDFVYPCPTKGNCSLMRAKDYYTNIGEAQAEWFEDFNRRVKVPGFNNGNGSMHIYKDVRYRRCDNIYCHRPTTQLDADHVNKCLNREPFIINNEELDDLLNGF